ncbi:MAG: hypothetical protein ABEJ65_09775 [bacterium]
MRFKLTIITVSFFLLALTGSIVYPSADSPCACVSLGGGTGQQQQQATQPKPEPKPQPKPSPSPAPQPSPSTSQNNQSASSGFPGFTPKQGKIDGFQGIPWGASVKEVKGKLGEPSYGHLNSWKVITKKWNMTLPGKVSKVLLYKQYEYNPKYFDRKANLIVGFINKNNKNRFAYAFLWWKKEHSEKTHGGKYDYKYLKDTIKKIFKSKYGNPNPVIDRDEKFKKGNNKATLYSGDRGYLDIWTDKYGKINFVYDDNYNDAYDPNDPKQYISISMFAKPMIDSEATFQYPKSSSTTRASGPTGGPLKDELAGKRYGNKLEKTENGRIDGIKGLPWGSSPAQVRQKLGNPTSRKARKEKPYKKRKMPKEGKKVWVYKDTMFDQEVNLYFAFDKFHVSNNWGLVWAAMRWPDMDEDVADRVENNTAKSLKSTYGDPTKQNNFTNNEKPHFTSRSHTGYEMWEDDYGRMYFIHGGWHDNQEVYYQSKALLEKRQAEIEEASSEF